MIIRHRGTIFHLENRARDGGGTGTRYSIWRNRSTPSQENTTNARFICSSTEAMWWAMWHVAIAFRLILMGTLTER